MTVVGSSRSEDQAAIVRFGAKVDWFDLSCPDVDSATMDSIEYRIFEKLPRVMAIERHGNHRLIGRIHNPIGNREQKLWLKCHIKSILEFHGIGLAPDPRSRPVLMPITFVRPKPRFAV
jgi:hypothetical protein